MSKFGDELIVSMKQAAAHSSGRKPRGMRVTKLEVPDVKAIRRSLRMSQDRFAVAYRIPLPTLKNREQGRRHPDAPAAAYCWRSSGVPRRLWKRWRDRFERVAGMSKLKLIRGSGNVFRDIGTTNAILSKPRRRPLLCPTEGRVQTSENALRHRGSPSCGHTFRVGF